MKRLVLASSSPRRKELLELHKFDFIIDFQEIEEVLDESLALPLRLEKLAYQKAAPIALKYPSDIVIGADTMVCLENQMLGKAGAYALQGEGKALVAKVEGNLETVIGMPVWIIEEYLNNHR